jgi:predicted transcriptional regulator
MASVKARMAEIIQEQPEDATYEEIIRELAFERMVERGLADSRAGRSVENEEMLLRMRSWRK